MGECQAALPPAHDKGPMNTFFKHQLPSRVSAKKEQKRQEAENWQSVCRHVDARDGHRCRACGARCNPQAMTMLEKAHHHHVEFRSRGGMDTTENTATLCAQCHEAVHRHSLRLQKLTPEGADGPLAVERYSDEHGWYIAREEMAVHRVRRD